MEPTPIDDLLVVMPTYNEAENVPVMVARIHAVLPDAHILIVDDGSPDGTGEIAAGIAADDPRVMVLHRAGKQGLGRAYHAAFRIALDKGYRRIVQMDADGSHRPEDLPRLLAIASGADIVIGSRWIPGGVTTGWSTKRQIISILGNTVTRVFLGVDWLHDLTGGFRLYHAAALRDILEPAPDARGFAFQVEMARRALLAGMTLVEVPITFEERRAGDSKMNAGIALEGAALLAKWTVQGGRDRMRRIRRPAPSNTYGEAHENVSKPDQLR